MKEGKRSLLQVTLKKKGNRLEHILMETVVNYYCGKGTLKQEKEEGREK